MRTKPVLLISLIIVIAFAVLMFLRHSTLSPHHHQQPVVSIAPAFNSSGLQVLTKLSQQNTDQNFVYAPLSTNVVLAMLQSGAAGNTQQQLTTLLHWSHSPITPAVQQLLQKLGRNKHLLMSNSLWITTHFDVEAPFKQRIINQLGGTLRTVNFIEQSATQKQINLYVSGKTDGMIPKLLTQPLPKETVLALINTLYFHGQWLHPFSETTLDPFYVDGKKPKLRYMMHQVTQLPYTQTKNLQIVALPYKDPRYRLWILLPNNIDTKLAPIFAKLSNREISQWAGTLKTKSVLIRMPRFSFSSRWRLIPILQALGVTDAFDGRKADFNGISDKPGLHVSTLLQQARIQVNEKGTKASAATLSAMNLMAIAMTPANGARFIANHPFIFLIRDHQTGTILFAGQVMDPDGH